MGKPFESDVTNAAINRAVRRGRITKQVARHCMSVWPVMLAVRDKAVKCHCWGADMLNRAGAARRAGQKILARQLLADARFAITMSYKT